MKPRRKKATRKSQHARVLDWTPTKKADALLDWAHFVRYDGMKCTIKRRDDRRRRVAYFLIRVEMPLRT